MVHSIQTMVHSGQTQVQSGQTMVHSGQTQVQSIQTQSGRLWGPGTCCLFWSFFVSSTFHLLRSMCNFQSHFGCIIGTSKFSGTCFLELCFVS